MNELISRDFFSYNLYFPFASANQELTKEVNIISRGPFELFFITANNAAAFTFEIVDTGLSQSLSNQKISSTCMAGTGQRPFILPVTYVFRRNRTIRINAKNGSTASNAGYITLIGATRSGESIGGQQVQYSQRNDIQSAPYDGQFFCYAQDITFTAADQVNQYAIDLFNNRAFELFYILSTFAQGVSLDIQDMAAGRVFSQSPTPYQNMCGTAQYPSRLPVNHVFEANGAISITATNTYATGAHSGSLVFVGANLGATE